MAIIHKFGRAIVGTSYTPVCSSGFYRMPTAATALEIVSDDANDTAAGTGAQEVTIYGIESDWSVSIQVVELNGLTAVNIPTSLMRVYRCFVSRSGTYGDQSGNSHAGTITIQEQTGGLVWCNMDATDFSRGQSQIGMYTVPLGKVAQVRMLLVHVNSTKPADVMFIKRENADDVTTPFTGAVRTQLELDGVATEAVVRPDEPLGPYPAKTDIGCLAKVGTGTGSVSVDFEIHETNT